MPQAIYQKIYDVIKQIPKGHVATYGQIARLAGIGQPRRVGYALRISETKIPWHRVINSKGEISARPEMGFAELQQTLLEKEGITFDHNRRVSLKKFQWQQKTRNQ